VGIGEVLLITLAAAVALVVVITLIRSVRVVPQQRMDVVERLGKYQRTLSPGLNILVPFLDAVRTKVDMREQVVSFPPQPVITSDNLVVSIDTVLYFRVVDPVRATYEIANFLQAIEQLVVTTLRNVIGSLDLEKALTSREEINRHLSGVLDETTGRWGIKVTRVEIKAIEPPPSIRDSMEKQMRAERDRRAAILNAEGVKQSQILTAQGEQQAAVLRAEGERQAAVLRADGQAKAIRTVFDAIHTANPDPKVLAYQYLQALPQIAAGPSNKVWIVPTELTRALEGIGGALGGLTATSSPAAGPAGEPAAVQSGPATRERPDEAEPLAGPAIAAAKDAAAAAEAAVADAAARADPGSVPAVASGRQAGADDRAAGEGQPASSAADEASQRRGLPAAPEAPASSLLTDVQREAEPA
jgi:regulator of protease activity HflC (stomatin/prohibitin superfamily)